MIRKIKNQPLPFNIIIETKNKGDKNIFDGNGNTIFGFKNLCWYYIMLNIWHVLFTPLYFILYITCLLH
jgi:hypothetical protein